MDREKEENRFLGFFDICSKSMKFISRWRNIILIPIILLTFMILNHMDIFTRLAGKIIHNKDVQDLISQGTTSYNRISDLLTQEWTEYWLIKAVCFIFLLVLSFLSTSVIVYTITRIYSGKEITYQKVMSTVPKVWKRLTVTSIYSFGILIVYNFVALLFFVLLLVLFAENDLRRAFVIMNICGILYFFGLVYVSLIWQLASVVSILEESYGFPAMLRSRILIKGKVRISVIIFLLVNFCLGVTLVVLVVRADPSIGLIGKIGLGAITMGLTCICSLVGFVWQTFIDFVCKSYHHENIDKSSLWIHLEDVCHGEYLPINKEIHMEKV